MDTELRYFCNFSPIYIQCCKTIIGRIVVLFSNNSSWVEVLKTTNYKESCLSDLEGLHNTHFLHKEIPFSFSIYKKSYMRQNWQWHWGRPLLLLWSCFLVGCPIYLIWSFGPFSFIISIISRLMDDLSFPSISNMPIHYNELCNLLTLLH